MKFTKALLLLISVTTARGSAPYYPDFAGKCLNDGREPTYMQNSGFLFTNKKDCCARHAAWDVASCMGDGTLTSGEKYYADWLNDNTCKNDGAAPAYMVNNPTLWLHDTLSSCCMRFYGWKMNVCMAGAGAVSGSLKWYMDYTSMGCVQDCEGPSPCGDLANSWDILYNTQDQCCNERMWWDKKACKAVAAASNLGPNESVIYVMDICFVASGCGLFSDLDEFEAAVEDMAGCSDVGCKVDVVEQQTSGCTTCTIANTRKIRRRVQSSTELAGFASKIKFEITATSASLDLTLVNQRLQTNLAASNDDLADRNKLFRLTTVTTTPQTVSPTSTTSSTSATTVAVTTSSAGQNPTTTTTTADPASTTTTSTMSLSMSMHPSEPLARRSLLTASRVERSRTVHRKSPPANFVGRFRVDMTPRKMQTDSSQCQPLNYSKNINSGICTEHRIVLKVFAYERVASLKRLMESLLKADFLGDTVPIEFYVEGEANPEVISYVENFSDWKGPICRIFREEKIGLMNNIMSSWDPLEDTCEYAIMLEDDIEVSPHFYFYAKSLISKYAETKDMIGISLYTPSWNEIAYPHKTFEVPTSDPIFMMQLPCSWGAVYFPDRWREFKRYFDARISGFDQVSPIPNSNSENWERSWKRYLIELMYFRGWTMLYPNFENLASLSTNHREQGEHTGIAGAVSTNKNPNALAREDPRYFRQLVKQRSEMDRLFNHPLPPVEDLILVNLHHEVSDIVSLKRDGLRHSLLKNPGVTAIVHGDNICSLDVLGSMSYTTSFDEHFFIYHPQYGLSNQIRAMQLALEMAKQLNRTLVVPPVVTLDGSLIDPWEFFDLESLPWRWIHYEDFQWAPSDMLRLVDMNAFTSGDKRFAPNIADESFFNRLKLERFISERVIFDLVPEGVPVASSGALFKGCKDKTLIFNNIYFYSSADWNSKTPEFSSHVWAVAKEKAQQIGPYNCLHLRRGDFQDFCNFIAKKRSEPGDSVYKSNYWDNYSPQKCFMDPLVVANVVKTASGKETPLLLVTNEKNTTLLDDSFRGLTWKSERALNPESHEGGELYLQPAIDQAMCQMSEKFYGNFFSTFSQSIKSRRSSNVSCMLGFDAGCLLPMIDARGGSEKLPTVSYVTSFWAETEDSTASPHRKEIQAAILSNINNRNFDQVVVLLDGITEHANCTHFIDEMYLLDRTHNLHVENENAIQKLTCINAPGRQLTYFQIFNYTLTDAVLGDVVVVSNADQAFDNTISKARHLSPSALAVLGTRGFSDATVPTDLQHFYDSLLDGYLKRNASQEEVDRCSTTPNSWDTFIFHRMMVKGKLQEADFLRMNVANESVPFYMNEYGAENAALWALERHSNFSYIYNACDEISSWAFHLTQKMHKSRSTVWKTKAIYRGEFMVPEPYGFASKYPNCVKSGDCFSSVASLADVKIEESN